MIDHFPNKQNTLLLCLVIFIFSCLALSCPYWRFFETSINFSSLVESSFFIPSMTNRDRLKSQHTELGSGWGVTNHSLPPSWVWAAHQAHQHTADREAKFFWKWLSAVGFHWDLSSPLNILIKSFFFKQMMKFKAPVNFIFIFSVMIEVYSKTNFFCIL